MSSYPPPTQGNDLRFNPANFQALFEGLSIAEGDKRYLRISGGSISGSLSIAGVCDVGSFTIGGSALDLSAISGVAGGTAQANKALVLNGSSSITSGLVSLSSSILSATTRIETQNSSATLITSSSNCDAYGLHLHSVLASSNGIYSGSSIAFNNSSTDNVPLSAICLDKVASSRGELVISTRNGTTCLERARFTSAGLTVAGTVSATTLSGAVSGAQTGITSLGTLSALNILGTTDCETVAGTAFSTTTRTSDYNLIISNASDTTGSTAGLCFAIDDSAYDTYTPSVVLLATRVATSIQYAASDFDIQLRSNTNILSPMVSRLMIKRAGGIGIGTTAPIGSVSIVGNSSYAAGGWRRIMYLSNDSTTPITAEIQIVSADSGTSPSNGLWLGTISDDPVKIGVGNTSIMYLNTSNRVAINLSGSSWSPEADLHVNGQIWSNAYYHSKQNVDGKAVYRSNWSQSNYMALGTDSTVGAMRLGTCDANFNWVSYLPVRGGSYTNASDRRIKKDIVDIPYGLAEILKMKPRKFAMRSDGSEHIGFIAQEMLEIIPECVSGVESPNDELNDQGEPINPMGIDLSSLVSVLCRAIQELNIRLTNIELSNGSS
jgi:hypothetical protein